MPFDQNIAQKSYEGRERRVGYEFELSELSLREMADAVQRIFGGTIEEEGEFSLKLKDADYGDFSIESDSHFLKGSKLKSPMLATSSRMLVPHEIVTPPIPLKDMGRLEDLRLEILARSQKKLPFPSIAPCGLHINAEVPEKSVSYILDVLRAFAFLQDELLEKRRPTLLRRLWPYIAPYPEDYCQLLRNPFYEPDLRRMVDDYLRYNPTRNRALDALPLFLWMDESCLASYHLGDEALIKKRPTFHYRLPNCRLADPDWTVASEWNSWAAIEKLAADKERMKALMQSGTRSERILELSL